MATFTKRIASGNDDGYWAGSWNFGGSSFRTGRAFAGNSVTGGVRFNSVTIPHGSTINSASITLQANTTDSDTPSLKIYGIDEDDTANFTSDPTGRTKTSASVDWDFTTGTTAGNNYQTPDLAAIVQEIIDRAGWSTGNDMGFLIEDDGSTNDEILDWDGYAGDSANAALLTIDYTLPPASEYSLDLESGSSQYASIADASQTGLDPAGDITLECWLKPETIGVNHPLINKLSTSAGYRLEVQSDNTLRVSYRSSSTNPSGVALIATAVAHITTAGQWYHIAASIDVSAQTCAFYINGSLVASAAVSGGATSITNSADAFSIGWNGSTGYADGLIDDVRVWDALRTQQQIQDNMFTELVGNESNLQGYWKLNNNYEDSTSNNNDLTASGSPTFSTDVPRWDGNKMSLSLVSSSSQAVSITDNASLKPTGNFTVEGWFKTSTTGTSQTIFQSYSQNSNVSGIHLLVHSDNKVYLVVGRNNGLTQGTHWQQVFSSSTHTNGLWNHVAGVYNGSTITIYINGIQAGQLSWTNACGYAATNYVRIGCGNDSGSNTRFFNGQLDDIRFWSEARTITQIRDNMFRDVTSDTNLIDSWKLNGSLTSSTGNNNGSVIGSPVFSTVVPFPEYTTVNPVALSETTLTDDANIVSHWELDGNFTDSDSSGYNLTATGTPGNTSGKFNGAKSFVAATSYASISNASGPNLGVTGNAFSVSAWVKPTNTAGGWGAGYVLSKRSSNNGFYLALSGGTSPTLFVSNGTTGANATSPVSLVDNNYYHIVGTYNGSTARIYINGILHSTGSLSSGLTAATSVPFYLGLNSNNTSEGFTGELDDVFVMNRVLTDTEVFELYTGLNAIPTESRRGASFFYYFV